MNDIQRETYETLREGAEALRVPGLGNLGDAIGALAGPEGTRLEEPCTLAVVGRVKAGKSTFVNALLGAGEDLAKVGTTETTATINYFRYGRPADPKRPVTVHYSNGRTESVDPAFLHRLQSNDEATLQLAEGIERLEYRLEIEFLRGVTLVDTPGTGAVVEEHQSRTAEFMRLNEKLRERHDEQTRRLGDTADAVIYIIGQVAKADDRAILNAFEQATGGQTRAFNAIGVMGKIDLDPDILARRVELAGKAAAQLKDQLNTVIPVSAGLHRALDGLSANENANLNHLQERLRAIPRPRLQKLLDNEDFFSNYEFDDCPVSTSERQTLLGSLDWMVFTTIARMLMDSNKDLALATAELRQMAGFEPLRSLLERHIFARSHLLRCYRVLGDAKKLVSDARYQVLPKLRDRATEHTDRKTRFVDFVRRSGGNSATAQELIDWIDKIAVVSPQHAASALEKAERIIGKSYHRLEEYNADFQALHELEAHKDVFEEHEREELRRLLGHYGFEREERLAAGKSGDYQFVLNRQAHWHSLSLSARNPIKRMLSERAVVRLGMIAGEFANPSTPE